MKSLHDRHVLLPARTRPDFFRDYGTFKDFVAETPQPERIPLLILAYERYREIETSPACDGERYFWTSAYSILIRRLLLANLRPNGAEACLILGIACRHAYLDCQEGCDELRPVEIAERAFRLRPYALDLFDSARAYRAAITSVRSRRAVAARKALDLLLWHDVRHPAHGCWSSHVQRAIAAMPADEAIAWQLLLRHRASHAWTSTSIRTWTAKARDRLGRLGEGRFLQRLDEWFQFTGGQRVRLSPAGSQMLRLLVYYAGLVDPARARPILGRLQTAHWSQREQRAMAGLNEILSSRSEPDFT